MTTIALCAVELKMVSVVFNMTLLMLIGIKDVHNSVDVPVLILLRSLKHFQCLINVSHSSDHFDFLIYKHESSNL